MRALTRSFWSMSALPWPALPSLSGVILPAQNHPTHCPSEGLRVANLAHRPARSRGQVLCDGTLPPPTPALSPCPQGKTQIQLEDDCEPELSKQLHPAEPQSPHLKNGDGDPQPSSSWPSTASLAPWPLPEAADGS